MVIVQKVSITGIERVLGLGAIAILVLYYCLVVVVVNSGDDAISRVNNQGPRSKNPSPTNQERLLIQEIYCQTPKKLVIQWKSPADQSKKT